MTKRKKASSYSEKQSSETAGQVIKWTSTEELRGWLQCKTRSKNRCEEAQLAPPAHRHPIPIISSDICTYIHISSMEMHWQVVLKFTFLPQLPQGEAIFRTSLLLLPPTHTILCFWNVYTPGNERDKLYSNHLEFCHLTNFNGFVLYCTL